MDLVRRIGNSVCRFIDIACTLVTIIGWIVIIALIVYGVKIIIRVFAGI